MVKKPLLSFVASVVALVAAIAVQPTSLVTLYQPEVPKALRK
ncbi:AgrD family cyclic lactone autoinducer peptide [Paradesulfitobacterium ferrireducens]|nr:cyclic lactone autoinducer peptide [Paradesulfitobacterium ferrireducens]